MTFGSNGLSKDGASWAFFGNYIGGIVGTLLSLATVILIFKTYTNQVNNSALQQFESTYFKLVEAHRLSVQRCQLRNSSLEKEYYENTKAPYDSLINRDFFDLIYAILDREYNKVIGKPNGQEYPVFSKINVFFKYHYWMIGHYVRTFIAILEFVDNKKVNDSKFYIAIFRDLATIDELRMMFYVTIWKQNEEGKKWKALFDKYEIFNFIGNNTDDKQLINREADLAAYNSI